MARFESPTSCHGRDLLRPLGYPGQTKCIIDVMWSTYVPFDTEVSYVHSHERDMLEAIFIMSYKWIYVRQ